MNYTHRLVTLALAMLSLSVASSAIGKTFTLSFAGVVDGIGYTVGGVAAPMGTPFTLRVGIGDANASLGEYSIESVGYTLTVGSYATSTDFPGVLRATQAGPSIELITEPLFINPNEHFLVNLTGFGPSLFNAPATWGGTAQLEGDVIVRGFGGFSSLNELSSAFPYTGTLVLTVIPEPTSTCLAIASGIGLFALVARRGMRR